MRFRISFKVALIFALVVAGVTLLGAKVLRRHTNTIVPVVFEVNPPNPAPNSLVSMTIELDGAAAADQFVSIGSTDPQAFVDLPIEVEIPAGATGITFTATTSSVYTHWTVLAATANGGTALAVQWR